MVDFNLVLENDRVILRPLQQSDLDSLLELSADNMNWNFFTHDLSDKEGIEEWAIPAFEGNRLQFVVVDTSNNEVIGSTAFGNFSTRDNRLEIGWTWLGKAFQGEGYNSEIKKLMLTYCFETLELERVEFKTDVLNMQARKSLRNINAIEEGVLRSHTVMTKNRRRDTIYFSILKNEWPHVKRENDW